MGKLKMNQGKANFMVAILIVVLFLLFAAWNRPSIEPDKPNTNHKEKTVEIDRDIVVPYAP